MGGLTLPQLLRAEDALKSAGGVVKDKCIVFVFMHGGPAQTETFDPKMGAPMGIRSETGEIPTRIPGITFGGTFENLAKLNDKFSIVRSFTTQSGAHDSKPIVSKYSKNAQIGGHYARVAGSTNPKTGIPNNTIVIPAATGPKYKDLSAVLQLSLIHI